MDMKETLRTACMAAMLASTLAAPVHAESVASAQKELAQSQKALQEGRTPLPGERKGKVGGGSRLDEAYFQRLRGLERSVEQARLRLDRAYAARNALK